MTALIITALLLGITLGLIFALLTLGIIKINCPQCKKLKPLKEIAVFHGKALKITGQLCQQCQKLKPPVYINL